MIKIALGIITAASLTTISAAAQQKTAPGQQMHDKASVKGTNGASDYAAGQKMQDKGPVKGSTGASGYAPGHANDTKSGTKSTK
jgi:hypothetical protein